MKKALKWGLIILTAVVATVAVIAPVAVPTVVRSVAEEKLNELGFPAQVLMTLGYGWRNGPEISGTLRVALRDAPWRVAADFGAGFGTWHAHVSVPETDFSEAEPTVAKLLTSFPLDGISNLVFSGSVALDASVERTRATPVPVWKAQAPIRDVSACFMADETAFAIDGLSVTPDASGIADHIDISPAFLHAKGAEAAGFAFSNLTASILSSPRGLLVNEASAGMCGGRVSLYSLFLDPKSLTAGLTLFLDNVDAGDVLSHFNGFRGEASGRLHGKTKVFLKDGKRIRLSDAFLYSTPGETGKIKMDDASVVTDNLALAGIDDAARSNVANALTDLDYEVLRFDLRRKKDKELSLSIRVEGSATRGDVTVPVNLTLNFNGEIEQLINTGLGYSRKLKGNSK